MFIDFLKAFDSVKWDYIWKALNETKINKEYIEILKETYKNSRAKIRTDAGISEFFFYIRRGTKQGDKIAAILFCCVLAFVIRKTNSSFKSGLKIGSKLLSFLAYQTIKHSLEKTKFHCKSI